MFTRQLMLNGFKCKYLIGDIMDRYEKGSNVLEDIQKQSVEDIFKELEDVAPEISRFVVEFPTLKFILAKK